MLCLFAVNIEERDTLISFFKCAIIYLTKTLAEDHHMDIMTVEQAGKLRGVIPRYIPELCRDRRINYAYKIVTSWGVPAIQKTRKM